MQGTERHDAHLRIRILEQGLDGFLTRLSEASQQPDGTGTNEGVLILQQSHQRFNGLIAVFENGFLSRAPDVD